MQRPKKINVPNVKKNGNEEKKAEKRSSYAKRRTRKQDERMSSEKKRRWRKVERRPSLCFIFYVLGVIILFRFLIFVVLILGDSLFGSLIRFDDY